MNETRRSDGRQKRSRAAWILAFAIAGALLISVSANARPRRMIVVHRPWKPAVVIKTVRPIALRPIVVVKTAPPKPAKKVWVPGHLKRIRPGKRIWVPGHWKVIRTR
ncbi:MAG: hypothetical protein KAY24_16435 [Candidatus Eisenbacteria sp.]|nr:hypothetical protein [Candidatus Eisenbacteria bacterium]